MSFSRSPPRFLHLVNKQKKFIFEARGLGRIAQSRRGRQGARNAGPTGSQESTVKAAEASLRRVDESLGCKRSGLQASWPMQIPLAALDAVAAYRGLPGAAKRRPVSKPAHPWDATRHARIRRLRSRGGVRPRRNGRQAAGDLIEELRQGSSAGPAEGQCPKHAPRAVGRSS